MDKWEEVGVGRKGAGYCHGGIEELELSRAASVSRRLLPVHSVWVDSEFDV